ncbi:copper resistance protein CopC [Erythrobacter sp. W302b]|uniref:copper resistance protein CopC n=1 Tax=Erythrobacter sp. W302b TaxID=3389874 RepID=UPI00396B04F1
MRCAPILALLLAAVLTAAPAAAELPAPELIGAFPADQEQVEAPLDAITLIFAAETDLVNVTIITPDQRRLVLHDAATADEARRDSMFVLSLPEAVTLPGVYLVEIAASVTDLSDSTASALSTMNSFVITEVAAANEPAAASPD